MTESVIREAKRPAETRWEFRDAEAKLREVVRRARDSGPQRITLEGRDAVVVIAAEAYDQEQARYRTGQRLVDALAASPLRDVDLDRWPLAAGPVRDVEA